MRIMMVVAVLMAIGCPAGEDAALSSECTQVATQCRLAPGKLGVCTMNTDQTLFCAPQH